MSPPTGKILHGISLMELFEIASALQIPCVERDFTPQDGNSLLSSIAATLRFLDPGCYKRKIEVLRSCMFSEI